MDHPHRTARDRRLVHRFAGPGRSRGRRVGVVAGALTTVAALAATGCASKPDAPAATPLSTVAGEVAHVPAGTSSQVITVHGHRRGFRLYRPADLDTSHPVPLVVMLHGGYGSAAQAEASYGWDAKADEAGFVVAYPDGENRAWNAGGGCCGRPGEEGLDDVGFITQLVQTVGRELPVDPRRTYATGMSNGALMSYRLACDTDLFAAIGPVAGTLMGPCEDPSPTSVIHIHGLADDSVPFHGGQGQGFAKAVNGMAVPDLIDRWRTVDDCGPADTTESGPVTRSVSTCTDGRSVVLITVDGAGHQWPGSKKPRAGAAEPSKALDATSTIWDFFAAHPAP